METHITCTKEGERTGIITAELVVGKIMQIALGAGVSKVLLQTASGERKEVTIRTDIFNGHKADELSGANVICAVLNTQRFDLAPTVRDQYQDHTVLHILDGTKAGTMLEYANKYIS